MNGVAVSQTASVLASHRLRLALLLLFFGSGCAALIYEVVWLQLLALVIGSSAVYDGGGGAVGYAAAKAGLDGMVVYLTRNYARKGILANVIHPCVIDTELLRQRYSDEEKLRNLTAQIPAGRLGTPQDVAGLVAYLASSWGDYICGQSFLVDGGRTLFR